MGNYRWFAPRKLRRIFGAATGGSDGTLTINDATHSHLADNVALTQVHNIAIQDATHASWSDGPAFETFNKADGDILGPVQVWSEAQGDIDIVSNRAVHDAATGAISRARAEYQHYASDQYVRAHGTVSDTVGANPNVNLAVRMSDTGGNSTLDMWVFQIRFASGGSVAMFRTLDGTSTNIGTASIPMTLTPGVDYEFEMTVTGDGNLKGYISGVEVISVADPASGWPVGFDPGKRTGFALQKATSGTSSIDDWEGGPPLRLTQNHVLAIQDATHGHTADNVALTQVHNLTVQDATHGHTADNVVLTTSTILVISDATHSHTADNLALTQVHVLSIQDATHAHQGDNVVLTQVHNLVVQDALHGHTGENLVLVTEASEVTLVIQDATHLHFVDSAGISIPVVFNLSPPVVVRSGDMFPSIGRNRRRPYKHRSRR